MSRKPKVTKASKRKPRKAPPASRRESRASTTQRMASDPPERVSVPSRARRGGGARSETRFTQLPLPHVPEPAARPTGRPTTFNPELGARLCKLVSLGVPIGVACRGEGVSRTTFYAWRHAGQRGTEPYAQFESDFQRAREKPESAITVHVVTAAALDWRAGAWWLERCRPERYGAKQTVKIEKAAALMSETELDAAIALYGYVRAQPDAGEPNDPA